jgi:hypothetical protein
MTSIDSRLHTSERRIWLLIAAACVVPAALDALQTYFQARLNGEPPRWQDVAFQGAEWLFLGALTPITYYLAKRFPLRRGAWKRALAVHTGGALALCIGWASLGVLLGNLLNRYPAGNYFSWILTSVRWSPAANRLLPPSAALPDDRSLHRRDRRLISIREG